MNLSIEQFSAVLGTTFLAHTCAGAVELKLIAARESPRGGLPEQFRAPLLLLLEGPAAPLLHDDHYDLDHPDLGRNRWFMAPVADPGASGRRYQIIFN